MPKAPTNHTVPKVGTSHHVEVTKKRDNLRAYQRQAKRQHKTNSSIWRSIRADFLSANPLCVHCEQKGITRSATHLDHIDGDSWNNGKDNYQGLCFSCHSTKTNKQDGGFGNQKK